MLCIPRDLGLQLTHLLSLPLVLSFQCPYLGAGLSSQGPRNPNGLCLLSHVLHLVTVPIQGTSVLGRGLGTQLLQPLLLCRHTRWTPLCVRCCLGSMGGSFELVVTLTRGLALASVAPQKGQE